MKKSLVSTDRTCSSVPKFNELYLKLKDSVQLTIKSHSILTDHAR